jgi:hypothetical protein
VLAGKSALVIGGGGGGIGRAGQSLVVDVGATAVGPFGSHP